MATMQQIAEAAQNRADATHADYVTARAVYRGAYADLCASPYNAGVRAVYVDAVRAYRAAAERAEYAKGLALYAAAYAYKVQVDA